jgi:hypothetical protein
MGLPAYVVQHFDGAIDDYQHGVMAGTNDNVERLTGQKAMSVGEFARAHLDQLLFALRWAFSARRRSNSACISDSLIVPLLRSPAYNSFRKLPSPALFDRNIPI